MEAHPGLRRRNDKILPRRPGWLVNSLYDAKNAVVEYEGIFNINSMNFSRTRRKDKCKRMTQIPQIRSTPTQTWNSSGKEKVAMGRSQVKGLSKASETSHNSNDQSLSRKRYTLGNTQAAELEHKVRQTNFLSPKIPTSKSRIINGKKSNRYDVDSKAVTSPLSPRKGVKPEATDYGQLRRFDHLPLERSSGRNTGNSDLKSERRNVVRSGKGKIVNTQQNQIINCRKSEDDILSLSDSESFNSTSAESGCHGCDPISRSKSESFRSIEVNDSRSMMVDADNKIFDEQQVASVEAARKLSPYVSIESIALKVDKVTTGYKSIEADFETVITQDQNAEPESASDPEEFTRGGAVSEQCVDASRENSSLSERDDGLDPELISLHSDDSTDTSDEYRLLSRKGWVAAAPKVQEESKKSLITLPLNPISVYKIYIAAERLGIPVRSSEMGIRKISERYVRIDWWSDDSDRYGPRYFPHVTTGLSALMLQTRRFEDKSIPTYMRDTHSSERRKIKTPGFHRKYLPEIVDPENEQRKQTRGATAR